MRSDQVPDDSRYAGDERIPPAQVARPPSLAEHVSLVLREQILAGQLTPGEHLTETTVMKQTGVSRTPVREGLRRLESEGLVVTYRGRGAYVTYRLSPVEACLIYDCRLVLEPYLTKLAAERMTPETLASIRAVLERFTEAIDADPREVGQLDADFHLGIYEASRSELTSVLRGYWSRLQLELSERVYATEVPRRFLREHRAIFQTLEQRDPNLAYDRMREHISHGRRALVRALGLKAAPEAQDGAHEPAASARGASAIPTPQ